MTTNHQRVTEGFQILTEVLAPYVARELRAKFDNDWWDQGVLSVLYDKQKRDLPRGGEDDELVHKLDAARCLARLPQRFFATVELDPDRAGRDAGRIAAGLAAPNGPAKEQSAGDR